MKQIILIFFVGLSTFFIRCTSAKSNENTNSQPVYKDIPYLQDFSIKYYKSAEDQSLKKSYMDRNGVIQVLSDQGLQRTHDGQFLYPGELSLVPREA